MEKTLIPGLYELLSFEAEADTVTARVRLDRTHDIFKGHFPGNPVMPGVCSIQIVKELAEKALGCKLFLVQTTNVKFMALINPEVHDTLTFELVVSEAQEEVKIRNTVSFEDTLALKLSAVFRRREA